MDYNYYDVLTNIQGKEFSIKADGVAFQILSSSLYSDPIKAIIRELSCNAYDAHRAAGKEDVPFYVHFPTAIEPYFSIQDYGIGLSEEDIFNLYTTYFDSDKRDSNFDTGMFGLGSKTPFAYTDSFTVISRFQGTESVYMAFLDESKTPNISKIDEYPTEECNGLTVKFAYDRAISDLKNAARDVWQWFPVKPLTNIEIDIPSVEYSIQGDGWAVDFSKRFSVSKVIQGNVAYPLTHNYFAFPNVAIYLWVDIGEVNPQPSREALHYDDKTVNNIQKRLNNVSKLITDNILDKIENFDSLYEARKFIESNPYLNKFLKNNQYVYHGKLINRIEDWLSADNFPFQMDFFIQRGYTKKYPSHIRDKKYSYLPYFRKNLDMFVIFDDGTKAPIKRIKNHFHENVYRDKLAIFIRGNWQKEKFFAQLLMKYLGWPPYMFLSELDEPPEENKAKYKTASYYKIHINCFGLETVKDDDSFDFSENQGVYVIVKDKKIINCDGTSPFILNERSFEEIEIYSLIRSLSKMGLMNENEMIYGFRTKDLKKIERNSDNWTPFNDFLKKKIKENKGELQEKINNYYLVTDMNRRLLNTIHFNNYSYDELNNYYLKKFKAIHDNTKNNLSINVDACIKAGLDEPKKYNIIDEFLEKNPIWEYLSIPPLIDKSFLTTIEPYLKE